MRASTLFRLLVIAAMGVTVAIWFHERAATSELQSRLTALRKQEQSLSGLRAERNRLRELLAAVPRMSGASAAHTDRDLRRSDTPLPSVPFATEEWTPATAWRNEGRSTPRSTIATLLWAAAGGDLAAMQTVLEFDDAARRQARAWFETLPPATRSLYATPEDFVASVTMGRIPPTSAQMSWFHQTDAEHAVVGLMLAAPESEISDPVLMREAAVPGEPPSFATSNPNRLAVLSLRQTPAGWRVIVPVSAIDRMAKVLRAKTTN